MMVIAVHLSILCHDPDLTKSFVICRLFHKNSSGASIQAGGGGSDLMFCSIDSLDFSFKKWQCYHVAMLGSWLNGLYTT